ncbi:MAG: LPS assembly protein LptD [Deltaproteobacteria bacterium]|nr:LPS assembly protein LptD [Deltaproteobacteria bacterium]
MLRCKGIKKLYGLLAMLFFSCLAASPLWALEKEFRGGPVAIEADSIAYDGDEDVFHAIGKVLITFSGGYLKADTATLFRATNRALAEGNVYLKSDQDILEGKKVSFDIVTKTGTVDDGKMFLAQNHFYIKGDKIEKKGEADYRLENATVTSCDGDAPDWSIAGSELDVTVDGYGVLKHGRLLARDLPVLYLPYFIFPAKTTRQSGLLFPMFTYSKDKNGLDIQVPFYWAISESADATFYQRYMSQRGFKEGVEFRYYPSAETSGTLYADFLNDHKNVKETVGSISRDWQESQNRWSFYLNHETTFSSGFAVRSDISRVSDHWYFKDFSSSNYYLDNYSASGTDRFRRITFLGDESLGSLDSTVRLTKNWSQHNLTAVARYTDDLSSQTNNATLQKYPEVILTGFRQTLFGSPLQYDFTATYDNFYRQEGQKGHLWEVNPTVYLPLRLGPYVQATPQAGFRGNVWDRSDSVADSGDKYGDREVFTLGTTLSTEIYRVFDVKGEEVEKIRHGIRPDITYTFIPEASQNYAPDFLARIPAQNNLTYGITNTFLTRMRAKDGKISYREMMRFRLGQIYDIQESRRDAASGTADNRPFGAVTLELDLSPIPSLSFAARNIYSVNSGVWTQTNYDLAVSDSRGDSAILGYRYTQSSLEEVNLTLKAALTPSLDALYILRQNRLDNKIVESTVGIKYRKQCWIFEFNVTDTSTDRAFMFYFSLLGLGRSGGGVSLSKTGQSGQ